MRTTSSIADTGGALRPLAALSLDERRERWSGDLPAELAEQAASLLKWWERSYFPGRSKLLTRRLRAAGHNRQTVLPLLVAGAGGPRVGFTHFPLAPPADRQGERVDFGAAFGGFLASGWRDVAAALAFLTAGDELTADPDAIRENFRAALYERLVVCTLQTFTLRMHAARIAGRLSGNTPTARYRNWIRAELQDPVALGRLLAEYPVLERALWTTTSNTARAWAEMLERLRWDWLELRTTFAPTGTARAVTAVAAGLGDSHAGGRSVMQVSFDTDWSVLYKPRSLAVDLHVQELLNWLNQHGLDPTLRCLKVLDCGDHGWVERVQPGGCDTAEGIGAFYRRQGALLLVLYLLDASDIHSENLIASGEHPVLVDLETLFQAPPRREDSERTSSAGVRERAFHQSVLRTLFLPLPSGGTVGFADLGGLRDLDGQLTPNRVIDLVNPATDEMEIVYHQRTFDRVDNLPRFDGQVVQAVDHTDDVVDGFTSAYHLASRHRSELSADGGPLARFGDDRVRHVLRNSSDYAMLLMSSYHPGCLRDGVRRSFVFDALWLDTVQRSYLERLIPSETKDLWDGDVPLFTGRVNSTDVSDSRGLLFADLLETTGLERVLARLDGFGEDDLARQVTCIRGSLAVSGSPPSAPSRTAEPVREAERDELLGAAVRIGERLAQLTIHEGGEAHWTGPIPLVTGSMYTVVDPDLYQGTAGIALFLGYLAHVTGRPDFEALARAAYRGVGNHLRTPDLGPSLGAFCGVPGLQYAALHLAHLWSDRTIEADVRHSLDHVARQVAADGSYDVHGGAAGGLLILLRIWEATGLPKALDTARACGRLLLRRAVPFGPGIGWTTKEGRKPLLGLSHGCAGIGWALSELALATGDRRFARGARAAIEAENALFEPAFGNWPDLRVVVGHSSDEPKFMWAWCQGAPGIAIARLRASRCPGLEDLRGDVGPALESTTKVGFGGAHCLCHGDLGNAEFFQLASYALADPRWRSEALRHASGVLADAACVGGWRCNRIDLVEEPGLLVGLAGIGYGLLRLAAPTLVPSVLALEGPRT